MAKQNMGGVYANMEFKPYEFHEYPKHVVIGLHGQYKVVYNAAEESALKQKLQKESDDAPAQYVPHVADPEKEILISRAREIGVPFNSQWSKAKLKTTVEEAEADVDNLPPEGIVTKNSEKAELLAEAKSLGINAHHMWGIPRIKAAITEAKK